MRIFDLKGVVESLNNPQINSLLNSIELYRGKTLSVNKVKKLTALKNIARFSSVNSSNDVGNVFVNDEREEGLLKGKLKPETFEEHMFVGYSHALDLIDEVYSYQPFDRAFISTLHYYIYKDYNPEFGGHFKDTQNYIQEVMPDGSLRTLFVPSAPEEVIPLLDNLIYQFNLCAGQEQLHKLVVILVFILDLLCIHPYNHGNGRLSRLVLHFLMKKYGYDIDEYFSIAYVLKQNLNQYIDVFEKSTKDWNEGGNDYEGYVTFMLKLILEGYRKLDYILEVDAMDENADEKVLKIVNDSSTPISKGIIERVLFSTSVNTIDKALSKLVKEGKIQIINKGRYARYFRV